MERPSLAIDGLQFDTLDGFFFAFQDAVLGGARWGANLDAFNDVLRGGFGSPAEGFVLTWRNHEASRTRLGYGETVRQLEMRMTRCHPSNIPSVQVELDAAMRGEGPTAYDWVVEILRAHGPGGKEAEDGVGLILA